MPAQQFQWWICTIPAPDWNPPLVLPAGVSYLRGQRELGSNTGYSHWQLCVRLERKGTLATMRGIFGQTGHYEPTRSQAAIEYCWKEDTRVEGTQFELGNRPLRRNSKTDWEEVWNSAKTGDLEAIPANVRVCHFGALSRIGSRYAAAAPIERTVDVFVGPTGVGKSRRAWEEAGFSAYPKDPRTKWWDGYQGHPNVVIDEFRGTVDISHLLRWFDRYPVLVEVKGGTVPLAARKIWITSNLHPRDWYPELDLATYQALERRINIVEF